MQSVERQSRGKKACSIRARSPPSGVRTLARLPFISRHARASPCNGSEIASATSVVAARGCTRLGRYSRPYSHATVESGLVLLEGRRWRPPSCSGSERVRRALLGRPAPFLWCPRVRASARLVYRTSGTRTRSPRGLRLGALRVPGSVAAAVRRRRERAVASDDCGDACRARAPPSVAGSAVGDPPRRSAHLV